MLVKQRSEEEVAKQPTLQVMEARTTEETKVVSGVRFLERISAHSHIHSCKKGTGTNKFEVIEKRNLSCALFNKNVTQIVTQVVEDGGGKMPEHGVADVNSLVRQISEGSADAVDTENVINVFKWSVNLKCHLGDPMFHVVTYMSAGASSY